MNLSLGALKRMDLASLVIFVLAVALYVWPVNVRAPGDATTPAAVVPLRTAAEADTLDVASVISANLLSASRRAPQRRYVSPDGSPEPAFSMPAAFIAPADSTGASAAASDDGDAVPALYGIVNADGVWRALLRLSSTDPNPTLLQEGDKRGAYRVVSIRSNAVVVAGPSGQRTLRLARPARGDSMGKTP